MESRIAVTHISSGDLWAGAEVQLFQMLASPRYRQNLILTVILFNEGELAQKIRGLNLQVEIIPERTLSPLAMISVLRRTLRKLNPAVLHTHGYKENIMGALASLGLHMPVSLRTEHGSPEHHYRWHQLPQKLIRALDRWIARRRQAAVVAVSPNLRDQLEQLYPGKVHQIVNAIDVHGIRREAQVWPEREPDKTCKLGFVGRLVPVKRVDLFLDTLALLKQRGRTIEGVVIGDGPLRGTLESKARTLGLDGLVTFKGFVNPALPALADLDVLVMCSDHEGLPMTLLEAMAMGVSIIGHNVGGIPYVLDDGACGLLVNRQSGDAYADAIERWLDQPDLRQGMRDNASKRVAAQFDVERLGQEYERLYRALLESIA